MTAALIVLAVWLALIGFVLMFLHGAALLEERADRMLDDEFYAITGGAVPVNQEERSIGKNAR